LNTAALSAAKKLSECGTTEPRYFCTSSGCSRTASPSEQKMIPCSLSSSFIVVPTLTESKIACTATPERNFCSASGIPSFSYVRSSSGSTSSSDWSGFTERGAEEYDCEWSSSGTYFTFGQCGSFIVSQRRYALSRQSSSHSGSSFLAEINLITASLRPGG